MTSFEAGKKCEKCESPIPDDFVNLLCPDCYFLLEEERGKKAEEEKANMLEQAKKNPNSPVNNVEPHKPTFGIKDKDYTENPEMEDKNQILANLAQFIYSHDPVKKRPGKLLWYPQRNMYNFIRNYCVQKIIKHPQYPKYVWKPKIVDVGCGSGTGSNILSQEADFVWAIDKNQWSIEFCKEAYERVKNGIYYSPQLTCDVFDVMQDSRETMKFDIVVAIEVIEHIYDTDIFLKNIISKFTKKDKKGSCHIPNEPTEFFISSPNRNFKKIRKDKPENPYHVREWRAEEFVEMLKGYFEEVRLYNQKGENVPENTEADEVIFAHCWHPKI